MCDNMVMTRKRRGNRTRRSGNWRGGYQPRPWQAPDARLTVQSDPGSAGGPPHQADSPSLPSTYSPEVTLRQCYFRPLSEYLCNLIGYLPIGIFDYESTRLVTILYIRSMSPIPSSPRTPRIALDTKLFLFACTRSLDSVADLGCERGGNLLPYRNSCVTSAYRCDRDPLVERLVLAEAVCFTIYAIWIASPCLPRHASALSYTLYPTKA